MSRKARLTHKPSWLMDRRDFLFVGMAGGLGLSLPKLLQAESDNASQQMGHKGTAIKAKAESIIHIFLPGGMAHQESFDPKPNAPVEYRGDMGSIDCKISGERINECLTRTAQIADKITICRSMTHGEAAHERGTHNMFTATVRVRRFSIQVSQCDFARVWRPKQPAPYVYIPRQDNPYAGSGYLSTAFGAFSLGADPADGNFRVQDLALPNGIDEGRFNKRRNMLSAIDEHFKRVEKSDSLQAMDSFYERAYGLVSSPKAREAFNIAAEDNKLRDEYGRHAAGQRMLMARRLVEAGVRMVTLTFADGISTIRSPARPVANCHNLIKVSPPSSVTLIVADFLTKPSSWCPASSAEPPRSTQLLVVTIGQRSSAWCWLVAVSNAAQSMVHRMPLRPSLKKIR